MSQVPWCSPGYGISVTTYVHIHTYIHPQATKVFSRSFKIEGKCSLYWHFPARHIRDEEERQAVLPLASIGG